MVMDFLKQNYVPSNALALYFTGCACVLNCGVGFIIYLAVLKKIWEEKLTLINRIAPYSKRLGLSRNQYLVPKFSLAFWRSSRTLLQWFAQWFAENQKSYLNEVSLRVLFGFVKNKPDRDHITENPTSILMWKILWPVKLIPCNYCLPFL